MRESDVVLKSQPSAHSLHTFWTLLKIALLGIVMEMIMGKGKKAPDPLWNLYCCCLWSACCLFQPLPIYTKWNFAKKTKKQIIEFLFYYFSLHQFALLLFLKAEKIGFISCNYVIRPYRLKQRELAGVKYSIVWYCLPGCHSMSILAAYARIPCELQSTCLNEYTLYNQHCKKRHRWRQRFIDSWWTWSSVLSPMEKGGQFCFHIVTLLINKRTILTWSQMFTWSQNEWNSILPSYRQVQFL